MQTREQEALNAKAYRGSNAKLNRAIVEVFSIIADLREEDLDTVLRGAKHEWQNMIAIEHASLYVPQEVLDRVNLRIAAQRKSPNADEIFSEETPDLLATEDEDPPTMLA